MQTDNRLLIKDWSFAWQEYRLSLQTDYKPNDNVHLFSEIWIRSFGFPDIMTSYDLSDKQKIAPVEFDLREAYIDLYGFISNNLDLRIGRQRIAWGSADKLNPTDNLNPNDLQDIWDFGRHQASNSIKASYYINKWSVAGVFIPTFSPAILPSGDWAAAFYPTFSLPAGLAYQNITDTIIMPERTLKQSAIYGAKVNGNVFNYDISLSYVYGRYDLPLLTRMAFIPTVNPGEVDLKCQLEYPRTHIIGFDVAGAIKDVGVWAEAAMFISEQTILTTDLSLLGLGTSDTVILSNKPYLRYILGLDYTLKNGIYINAQYLHGFVNERGSNNLEDYFMIGLDYKLLKDKLKLSPVNGAIEIKQWKDIKQNYAWVWTPEISYSPVAGAEIILGYRVLGGKTTTMFGRVKDNDEITLKIKYNF